MLFKARNKANLVSGPVFYRFCSLNFVSEHKIMSIIFNKSFQIITDGNPRLGNEKLQRKAQIAQQHYSLSIQLLQNNKKLGRIK